MPNHVLPINYIFYFYFISHISVLDLQTSNHLSSFYRWWQKTKMKFVEKLMEQVKSFQNIRTKKRRDKANAVTGFVSYSAKKRKEARFCISERIKSEKQSQGFCILLKINRTRLLVVDFNSFFFFFFGG